jgi:hypothetical protein
MRIVASKRKFVSALLIVILSGSFFPVVACAGDEPKTTPQEDDQRQKLDEVKTETGRQSDSAVSETSAALSLHKRPRTFATTRNLLVCTDALHPDTARPFKTQ